MAGGRNTFMLVMMFEKGNLVTDAIEMMGCTIVYSRLLHACPGATGILSPSPPAGFVVSFTRPTDSSQP